VWEKRDKREKRDKGRRGEARSKIRIVVQ